MQNKVAIFCGGKSLEHEISVLTSFEIFNNLNNEYEGFIVYIDKDNRWLTGEYLQHKDHYKDLDMIRKKGQEVVLKSKNGRFFLENKYKRKYYFDVAFLAVHGKGMEDGTLSALMEYYDIPYVGNSLVSSSISQDKWLTKFILHSVNVPTLPCFYINPDNYLESYIEKKVTSIGFPLIVKSNHLGSSIGIKKVENLKELYEAIELLRNYDCKILIEKYLTNFKELNQAITIQNKKEITSIVEEITPVSIFDYNDKYIEPVAKKRQCDDEKIKESVTKLTSKIYQHLGFSSVVRIDYLYDLNTNKIYFSEVNTIPGSYARKLFEEKNIPFDELLNNEIQKALSFNFVKRNKIRTLDNIVMSSLMQVNNKK